MRFIGRNVIQILNMVLLMTVRGLDAIYKLLIFDFHGG
jgi:hypothetical protein